MSRTPFAEPEATRDRFARNQNRTATHQRTCREACPTPTWRQSERWEYMEKNSPEMMRTPVMRAQMWASKLMK
uniref:Uncharacterized protein n=1 Tax=Vitis vinifera TaxID=29760 RepID=A5C1U4_VITVI|nr:hypothetical protein VITISV_037240 [Vitis vinifera]